MHAIDRCFGRPTVAKAIICSLIFHAGAFTLAQVRWWKPVKQVTFTGQRRTVVWHATSSTFRPSEQAPADPPTTIRPRPNDSAPLPTRLAAPRTVLAEKRHAAVQAAHLLPYDSVEPLDAQPPLADAIDRRRTSDPIEVVRQTTTRPTRIQRRPIAVAAPATTRAVPQIAGVEDRQRPDLSANHPPPYPTAAVRAGQEGTVVLRLYITATGRVEEVEISVSSGYASLDQAAIDAVQKWQARPATQAGRPVATVELLPVRFRLR